jgi:hypothetical protein
MLRQAGQDDHAMIEAIVRAAYTKYIDRIGKPPGPMLDDYRRLIATAMSPFWKRRARPSSGSSCSCRKSITCCSTTSQ